MSVYCEPVDYDEITAALGDCRSVLLVGCPLCANMSCAVRKSQAAYQLTLRGLRPVSMEDELERLALRLAREGRRVDRYLPRMPGSVCGLSERAQRSLRQRAGQAGAIVTLCCESGHRNARELLADKSVVAAMRATGLLAKIMRRRRGTVRIDPQSVRIVPFTVHPEA